MKRISTVVLAATATAALMLTGCSSEEPAEASGLRKNTATGQTSPQTESETGAPDETPAPEESAEASEAPAQTSAAEEENLASGRASDTTCAQFARLDEPEQQQLVQTILAENPDSTFAGNPNAALGTAKLVCNSSKLADQKVAVVAGIVLNG
ncbi:hypothetical protein [Nocardia flavorosea]|uniref:DUF732 domain-containing protein n=1 Tax=Nocardia flavorosea TaxID=53429 RepID=A0A846YA94_9NOCA|nr:hypothetical protein [Nocardia flavorosea]NKY56496.1 hypothetical protein [Nocardia flavorosea]